MQDVTILAMEAMARMVTSCTALTSRVRLSTSAERNSFLLRKKSAWRLSARWLCTRAITMGGLMGLAM